MRRKSIHIRNFRALEQIDVDLDSPVSVIVGPNAIGKTTLLEEQPLVPQDVGCCCRDVARNNKSAEDAHLAECCRQGF